MEKFNICNKQISICILRCLMTHLLLHWSFYFVSVGALFPHNYKAFPRVRSNSTSLQGAWRFCYFAIHLAVLVSSCYLPPCCCTNLSKSNNSCSFHSSIRQISATSNSALATCKLNLYLPNIFLGDRTSTCEKL